MGVARQVQPLSAPLLTIPSVTLLSLARGSDPSGASGLPESPPSRWAVQFAMIRNSIHAMSRLLPFVACSLRITGTICTARPPTRLAATFRERLSLQDLVSPSTAHPTAIGHVCSSRVSVEVRRRARRHVHRVADEIRPQRSRVERTNLEPRHYVEGAGPCHVLAMRSSRQTKLFETLQMQVFAVRFMPRR